MAFNQPSVNATFEFFTSPEGTLTELRDLGCWVLGFGNLGGAKNASSSSEGGRCKAAVRRWSSWLATGPIPRDRLLIASASDVPHGLKRLEAAYVALGGVQGEGGRRRGYREAKKWAVMGSPYRARYGELTKYDFVRGTVGGEILQLPAP